MTKATTPLTRAGRQFEATIEPPAADLMGLRWPSCRESRSLGRLPNGIIKGLGVMWLAGFLFGIGAELRAVQPHRLGSEPLPVRAVGDGGLRAYHPALHHAMKTAMAPCIPNTRPPCECLLSIRTNDSKGSIAGPQERRLTGT